MARFTVRPTRADVLLANAVAAHTGPRMEAAAQALTWGADEHVLCGLAAGWWLYCRNKASDQRRASRTTVRGHWRGIPISGNRLDAFPSGHAVHVGALASAAGTLPANQRNAVWSIAAALALTRIVLLAHWASDVAAGLAIGAVTERLLRLVTGYGREHPYSAKGRPPSPSRLAARSGHGNWRLQHHPSY
jgi:membrane-associated phospholipid phosphatase